MLFILYFLDLTTYRGQNYNDIFVVFLVQIERLEFAFEINRPLELFDKDIDFQIEDRREHLVDWLISVSHFFKCSQETLYHTVDIVDRYFILFFFNLTFTQFLKLVYLTYMMHSILFSKAELLQLNRTQFPSLGIFASKIVGNRKN